MLVRNSMMDQIYIIIKDRILRGVYPLGVAINIAQITNELGVSNTPVREALAKLETENLVVKFNSRYNVMSITNELNADLDQIVSIMMVGALEICEKKKKLTQLADELSKAFAQQLQIKKTGSDYEYLCATIDFDRTFVKVSENKLLESQFDVLSVFVMLVVSNKHKKDTELNLSEHRDILSAVSNMDIALAKSLLIQHFDKPLSIYPVI